MELKAKPISLIVKIVSVLFVVINCILLWVGVYKAETCTVGDICLAGGVIASIFADVSVNKAIDKFKKKEVVENVNNC